MKEIESCFEGVVRLFLELVNAFFILGVVALEGERD